MSKTLIIGATSAIVEATARRLAARKHDLYLVARNRDRLAAIADDLKTRGATSVATHRADLTDLSQHQQLVDDAVAALGGLDLVLIGHGVLGRQEKAQSDFEAAQKVFDANFTSVASLLTPIAEYMVQQKSGTIAVISSVAGDRGRQSNYIYGTSKAAKSVYLQGLRNRLYQSGVHVVTIKPGFVDTPMTSEFEKGGLLWATPDQIADGIVKAIDKKKNVAYLPWFWWPIMTIIKHVPETIFKRLKL